MTLYRQIAVSIILLFILCFLGTVVISTENLRTFLATQLESHAQDTATSLGLSLSPHMQSRDMPIISAMVDAIFDRGYYREISIRSVNGETLLSRSSSLEYVEVPEWFIKAVRLQPPTAEALVMSGWKQAATVFVTSHPGHAYQELWSNTVDTFWLFLIAASSILLLALLALSLLLRPLRRVEDQAEAICNRSYPIQERLPRTRELRRVVIAMNRVAEKVNSIFTEQAELSERLREQAYKDPVTGLGNRRYFNRRMHRLTENREEASRGAFFLIELNTLAAVNETSGYPAGDLLLRRTAEVIREQIGRSENSFATRLSGAGFGVVVAGLDGADAESMAETFCHELLQLQIDDLIGNEDSVHIGVALWKQDHTVAGLLAEADIALRAAQSGGQHCWHRYAPPAAGQTEVHGTGQWRIFLQQILESGNISFVMQPVFGLGEEADTLLHNEILLRIPEPNGTEIRAGVFMPMAERIGLASRIDRLAIQKLLDVLAGNGGDASLHAINLSSASLHDPVFIQWLCSRLQQLPDIAKHLQFEFPEYGVLKNVQDARGVMERLEALGSNCGIDHFGRSFHSFGYLRNIRASYLKLDGSYTRGIGDEEDNRFFIKALTDTAHSIDIRVIAQAVETEAERSRIQELKLDGIQGYLTGTPVPLPG
jgi:diguanylate cyclase (GGDEF)-like protein